MVLFLYRVLPSPRPKTREIWPGAVVGALLLGVVREALELYFEELSDFGAIYGSLGALMALLVFVFAAANVLVFGAEFASEWSRLPPPEETREIVAKGHRRVRRPLPPSQRAGSNVPRRVSIRRGPGGTGGSFTMSFAVRAALAAAALVTVAAPAADARVAADAAAAKPKSFGVKSLSAQRSVRAGSTFRVRGSVTKLRPRRAGTGRLTFSLRRTRPARSWRLRVRGTSRVRLTRSTRTRRFTMRLAVPRSVPAGRYRLRACVRRGNDRAGCRSRVLRVTRRAPGPTAHAALPGPRRSARRRPAGRRRCRACARR